MRVLSLNCQRGYTPGLEPFLQRVLIDGEYDFLLLQEFAKEVPSFVEGVGSYSLLQILSTDVKQTAQTCILYRNGYELLESSYIPFPKKNPDPVMGTEHATFGSLIARFRTDKGTNLIGSLHLHSGMDHKARILQIKKAKQQILTFEKPGDIVVFGGDCNFGLPGERSQAERVLAPEFTCATRSIGPTLNGRYSENVPHLPNRIAAFFGFFGIGLPLWTDHLFVDERTGEQENLKTHVLRERVSDHSPIDLNF